MDFTYNAYRELIYELKDHQYNITDYHHYDTVDRPCILRHDIDQSPQQAFSLARVEKELGVTSTYFVLLTSDFYNVVSEENRKTLHEIAEMGHTIGLHFDEMAYSDDSSDKDSQEIKKQLIERIQYEAELLSGILSMKIDTVSMHRPSKLCLESDLQIPGMINSYGKKFFNDFKYLSDSRHHWREDVLGHIRTESYERLHILTHAFWYHEKDIDLQNTLSSYLDNARKDRYAALNRNFTRLADALEGKV